MGSSSLPQVSAGGGGGGGARGGLRGGGDGMGRPGTAGADGYIKLQHKLLRQEGVCFGYLREVDVDPPVFFAAIPFAQLLYFRTTECDRSGSLRRQIRDIGASRR